MDDQTLTPGQEVFRRKLLSSEWKKEIGRSSEVLSRVKSFLPELQKSNESLPEHVATCVEIEEIGDLQTKPESGFTESDSGSHEEVSSTNVPKVNSCGSPTLEDDPSTNFKTEMNVDKFKNEDPNRHVEMTLLCGLFEQNGQDNDANVVKEDDTKAEQTNALATTILNSLIDSPTFSSELARKESSSKCSLIEER